MEANGEQKQTRVLAFEHDLLRDLTPDVRSRSMLHPSSMYALFNPFWWGHVSETWVHRRAKYRGLQAAAASIDLPCQPYTAVKFYFNDCFPPTDRNRAFVRETLQEGDELPAAGDDNVRALARNLFGDHVFAFEFTSVLLIVAVAGTVLLTRKSKRTGTGGGG